MLGPIRIEHVRFGIIGAYNTGFAFAVFAGLVLLFPKLSYMIVLLISHVLGVLNAYLAYRLFVFKVRGHWLRDLFRFWLVYLGALAVNVVALPLLVSVVGLTVLLSQACVVGVVAIMSWFGHKHVSFRRSALDLGPEMASSEA